MTRDALQDQFLERIAVRDIPSLRIMIAEGINVNDSGRRSREAQEVTPLAHAAVVAPDLVAFLVANGADVNVVGHVWDLTPLQWAVMEGSDQGVAALIEQGADPHLTPPDTETAVKMAAEFGRYDIFRRLIERCRTDGRLPALETLVHPAQRRGERIRDLVLPGSYENRKLHSGNVIYGAAYRGMQDIVEIASELERSQSEKWEYLGRSCVAAASNGHEKLVNDLLDRDPTLAMYKHRMFGSIHEAAAERGLPDLAQRVLDLQADPAGKPRKQVTFRDFAVADAIERGQTQGSQPASTHHLSLASANAAGAAAVTTSQPAAETVRSPGPRH